MYMIPRVSSKVGPRGVRISPGDARTTWTTEEALAFRNKKEQVESHAKTIQTAFMCRIFSLVS